MAKAIATNEIGGDLYCEGDLIFSDQNLANAGATTSAEFLLAQTMGAAQINIIAGTDGVSTADTYVVTVITADASGGTFDNTAISTNITVAGTETAGDLLGTIAVPREVAEIFSKLVITTAVDATADEVTAYQVGVC